MSIKNITSAKPVRFQHKGKRYRFTSLMSACRHFDLPYVPIHARIRKGWRPSRALTTPLHTYKPRAYKQSPEVAAYYLNKIPMSNTTTH